MDITSIAGILAGIIFVIYGIIGSGDIMNFFDVPSILIVVGGTFSAIIASFPFRILKNVGKHLKIICSSNRYRPEMVIDLLVEFAQIARRDGLLALETKAEELEDPFFKKSLMYVVDAMDSEKIRSTLQQEIENTMQRHEEEQEIYVRGSVYAPAFGMIGTLIGLINMLRSMDLSTGASSELGQNMSVALVTTFYGCILANLIFHPITAKLGVRDEEERIYKEIVLEGVLGIQEGDNPRNLKSRLVASLAQKKQAIFLEEQSAGSGEKKTKKTKKSRSRK